MFFGTIFKKLNPPQIMLLGFLILISAGAVLLSLPVATETGRSLSFVDALFTATSAVCVTGLVVVDTRTTFSLFGEIVILILIQIGGLGFLTVATSFFMIFGRRITLKDRLVLQEALNRGSLEGIVRLIRTIVKVVFWIEGVAAIILMIRWSEEMPLSRAAWYGLFHSVSIFNNAGFDLFGDFRSLTDYTEDVVVNLVGMTLAVLGGIGYFVLSDVLDYPKTKRLSLHSKVMLGASAILILIGAFVIFIFEFTNPHTLASLGWHGKVLASFYQSVTPRSVGTSTLDIAAMRQATQFFLIILMFIGAGPGSAGGGIKVTTFSVLIGAMSAMLRGREDVVLFRHRLAKEIIYKAITMTLLSISLIVFISMLLAATETPEFLVILFDVTSAFATCGLSMGLTQEVSDFGKVMLSLTMLLGRLGPITLAYALNLRETKSLFRYPEGKIIIG